MWNFLAGAAVFATGTIFGAILVIASRNAKETNGI